MVRRVVNKISIEKLAILFIFIFAVVIIGLSIFRNAIRDENLYLRETMIMSEMIKQGNWIGNYSVGLHGFIFKLPVALMFLVTGPSVAIATGFNIVLAAMCGLLFFVILKECLHFRGWAVATLLLFISGFEFVRNTPTFLRDIPVLFSTLLFIYSLFKTKNKWLHGLILMLMFDAKEHVFYMFGLGYFVYLFFESFIFNTEKILKKVKTYIVSNIETFLPFLIFSILMFATSLVPINMFNASILTFTEQGKDWLENHFSVDYATANLVPEDQSKTMYQIDDLDVKETARAIDEIVYDLGMKETKTEKVLLRISKVVNTGLDYLGKMIYPRSFSYISVPLIIVVPSVAMSVIMFVKELKKKENADKQIVALALMMWSYLFIYLIRTSHGRYLLALTPIMFIFFAFFLRDGLLKKKWSIKVIIATVVLMACSLFFEVSYIPQKIFISVSLAILFFILWWAVNHNTKLKDYVYLLFILAISLVSTGSSILFSYKLGQISEYLRWGANHEVSRIFKGIPEGQKVFVNDIGWDQLPLFYRKDLNMDPEWKWELKDYLPKDRMLIMIPEKTTYYYSFLKVERLKKYVEENKIERIVIIKSKLVEYPFYMQEMSDKLLKEDWVKLDEIRNLKNKDEYIFTVIK